MTLYLRWYCTASIFSLVIIRFYKIINWEELLNRRKNCDPSYRLRGLGPNLQWSISACLGGLDKCVSAAVRSNFCWSLWLLCNCRNIWSHMDIIACDCAYVCLWLYVITNIYIMNLTILSLISECLLDDCTWMWFVSVLQLGGEVYVRLKMCVCVFLHFCHCVCGCGVLYCPSWFGLGKTCFETAAYFDWLMTV